MIPPPGVVDGLADRSPRDVPVDRVGGYDARQAKGTALDCSNQSSPLSSACRRPSSTGVGIAPMGTKGASLLSRIGRGEALEIASKRSMKISASIVAPLVSAGMHLCP